MIAHVDMDAFYVSVELLRRPELRGKPVIVANGTPDSRGVVMTASYEARAFGVHSALPMAIAHRRCPNAIRIPSDMKRYREVSGRVMEVLRGFSDTVEVVGVDEAYLDLSASLVPHSRAREMKNEVRTRTGLVCSVGLAENKLLAKIASDLEKPDGLCTLSADRMHDRVGERPATLIPGVGPKTAERLRGIGVRTVAELARADPRALRDALGPTHGAALRELANGVDARRLVTDRKPKSESRETTFARDVDDRGELAATIDRLGRSVCEGLESGGYAGRTITLKIRLRPFKTFTRSKSLAVRTRDPAVVCGLARELLERFDPKDPVRLIGVGVAGLVHDNAPEQATG
ncbi:MAG: DNA polymerase IV, partial [Actinomycetota bacterium]|nr:DNA polymerase IV [Actinomycetota bacterium]